LVNAARIIASPLPRDNIYIKQRPVPFGEAAPFGALGLISSRLTASFPGSGSQELVNVHDAKLLASAFGKIGVSISTEVIFPNLIADEVRRGAHLLVNVTNLNRFHQSNLNKQVIAAATLRAVENGRFMVVSTDTGISAVIDPAGVVTSRSYANKRGAIFDTVQFLYNRTPFNKMGRAWWL
jgi:apolipoprotein N-acyltransferase